MHNALRLLLAFAAFGCLIAAWITGTTWLAVGFLVFGGLMLVLFPRESADAGGDPRYGWVIPESQPARTIVTVLLGLVCLAAAAALVLLR
ncbi:MAG TPA: hypothetical protein VF587_01700 [Solirubrobacteraceae bacterium]